MSNEKKTAEYLVEAYQHISNGGISIGVRTEADQYGHEKYLLAIGMSNFGVRQTFTIPVFAATPNILRIIADELESKNVSNKITDPTYLTPIITTLTFDDKETKYLRVISDKVVEVTHEDCYGPAGGQQVGNSGSKAAS